MYVKGAASGECFDNNEKIWAEVGRRLEAFKEANPDAAEEEAENVIESQSVEILELVLGRRKGNEIRAMGRVGKLVASTGSGSGSSRRRRESSSAEVPSSAELHSIIKKQKSKLARLGKTMKFFATLIPKIVRATGVEHAGLHEALQGAEGLVDDEDDDEDEDDETVDMSAHGSQVAGPAHSIPSGSGGIVMIPTPGLQPPPPPSGKGKGIADD